MNFECCVPMNVSLSLPFLSFICLCSLSLSQEHRRPIELRQQQAQADIITTTANNFNGRNANVP
eukprot:m.57543 g.57543  ORF g.57543 m.57543 type:complete len:64 (-) comp18903_c0_seq1:254-445(-)